MRETCSVAPVESWDKAPGGGLQGKALEALVFFNAETAFQMQTYVSLHNIVKFKTLLQKENKTTHVF